MTFLAPISSFAWQDFDKPLAMMLLSEGRYCTQISSVPLEHADTSGTVLLPHHAKTSFCIWEPHFGGSCFFPTRTHDGGSPLRPRMWPPCLFIMKSLAVEGNDGWSAASGPPGCCLSSALVPPSLGNAYSHALVSHMELCHRSEKNCS